MTFKSIETILMELEADGRLIRFHPPLDPDEAEKRTLFMTPKTAAFVHGQHNSRASRDYFSRVRAAFGEFVKGVPIVDNEKVFKKLHPKRDHIWEFRVTLTPQSRVLGAFLTEDVFVAIEPQFRDALARKAFSGRDGFAEAMEKVRNAWVDLFGTRPRDPCAPLAYCMTNVKG